MSGLAQLNTRIGTNTPDSVRSCMLTALTKLVKIIPRPELKGVADSPMTAARQLRTWSVHVLYSVCDFVDQNHVGIRPAAIGERLNAGDLELGAVSVRQCWA